MAGWQIDGKLPLNGSPDTTEVSGKAAVPVRTPRLRLHNSSQIAREIRRVYADVRANKLASAEGSRLVFMLNQLNNIVVDSELESKVAQLEQGRK